MCDLGLTKVKCSIHIMHWVTSILKRFFFHKKLIQKTKYVASPAYYHQIIKLSPKKGLTDLTGQMHNLISYSIKARLTSDIIPYALVAFSHFDSAQFRYSFPIISVTATLHKFQSTFVILSRSNLRCFSVMNLTPYCDPILP